MFDNYLEPKADLRSLVVPEDGRKQLLEKSSAYQPEGIPDPNEFHFCFTKDSYCKWVKNQEIKAGLVCKCCKQYSKEMRTFLCLSNLAKCGWKIFPGCGNMMFECHNVEFGLFCVYMVVRYCTEAADFVTDVGVKKVFIDTYNRCLAFVKFRMRKGIHEDWVYLSLPMHPRQQSQICSVLVQMGD